MDRDRAHAEAILEILRRTAQERQTPEVRSALRRLVAQNDTVEKARAQRFRRDTPRGGAQ